MNETSLQQILLLESLSWSQNVIIVSSGTLRNSFLSSFTVISPPFSPTSSAYGTAAARPIQVQVSAAPAAQDSPH